MTAIVNYINQLNNEKEPIGDANLRLSVQRKKKKILKYVNVPSADRLCAYKEFRLYAKNNKRNVCIYAKKSVPLYIER